MMRFASTAEWQSWQDSQQLGLRRSWRRARSLRGDQSAASFSLSVVDGSGPAVAFALDADSPSLRAAILEPALRLAALGTKVGVLTLGGQEPLGASAVVAHDCGADRLGAALPTDLGAIVTVGDHLAAGAALHRWARRRDIAQYVVQHGVLTPWSPPPPRNASLLAWSESDLEFWRSASSTRIAEDDAALGSQLLWAAARPAQVHSRGAAVVTDTLAGPPIFLGQLHGAELSRSYTRRSVAALRRAGPFVYRPHPAERDVQSRLQHARWRRRGVRVESPQRPLIAPGEHAPVLAHFSSGVLEAAVAGRAAFAYCAAPPPWLEELWRRYGMAIWGQDDCTTVKVPDAEPARRIAEVVRSA